MAKDSMAGSGKDPRALRQSETWLIPPGGGAGLKAGLVFPSPYFVGMSNLGFHVVYRILASRPEVLAERLFYQGPVDFPRSIESGRAGIGWTSYAHTAQPVITYAAGPGEEEFAGFYDNTDVAKKMFKLLRLPLEEPGKELRQSERRIEKDLGARKTFGHMR